MACGFPVNPNPLTPPYVFSVPVLVNGGTPSAFVQIDSNDFFGNGLYDDTTTASASGLSFAVCGSPAPAVSVVTRNRITLAIPNLASLVGVIIGIYTGRTGQMFFLNGVAIPAQSNQIAVEFLLDYDLQYALACDGWDSPTGECGIPGASACYPLSQAIIDISTRLSDLGLVHWTSVEITRYLVEALRTYNALTQSYRNRSTFTSALAAAFYDMPTVIPGLRAYTVTDRDLVLDCQYALMEPPSATVWIGTSMFTLAELTGAIQRRTDQFLRTTGAVVTRAVTTVTPDSNGRVTLPSNVITVRRAAWIMADGTVIPLALDSEWSLQKYKRTWQTPQVPTDVWPTVYSVNVTPPLTMQLGPPPSAAGTLELLVVVLASTFAPQTSATVMGIPDDWCWVIKWGALADLFGMQGVAFDPARAKHCEDRWQQGLELATNASVLLDGFVAGAVTQVNSVTEVDLYQRTWETTPGTPVRLLTTGQNIIGLCPPADDNDGPGYVITVDVIANMPVPVAPTDCVNLGIEDSVLDTIYDYAEYLAMVKEGAGQLGEAVQLLERFMKACGVTLKLDQAQFPNRGPVLQQTVQDVRVKPRLDDPEPTES